MSNKLYVAIQEWQTEKHWAAEFSANSYPNVYKGNMNTLSHIYDKHKDAFHVIMSDIYVQAR
jgi:hypothetical protein